MNDILMLFLSMSLSGSLLILALLILKPLYRNRTRRRWQYYIWLAVIARLLLPFSPQQSLSGMLAERAGWMVSGISDAKTGILAEKEKRQGDGAFETDSLSGQKPADSYPETSTAEGNGRFTEPDFENFFQEAIPDSSTASPEYTDTEPESAGTGKESAGKLSLEQAFHAAGRFLSDAGIKLLPYLWMIWLGVAALLLVRKITIYQRYHLQFPKGKLFIFKNRKIIYPGRAGRNR